MDTHKTVDTSRSQRGTGISRQVGRFTTLYLRCSLILVSIEEFWFVMVPGVTKSEGITMVDDPPPSILMAYTAPRSTNRSETSSRVRPFLKRLREDYNKGHFMSFRQLEASK